MQRTLQKGADVDVYSLIKASKIANFSLPGTLEAKFRKA